MAQRHVLRSLPGALATLLIVVTATVMAASGAASLFYEGWGQPVPRTVGYVAPAVACVALGLIAIRWPAGGGLLLVLTAVGAAAIWIGGRLRSEIAPLDVLLVTALLMVGPVIVAALLFLLEARHRRLLREEGAPSPSRWLGRHWREVLLVAAPVIAVANLSVQQVPALLARHDDGLRGARTIAGNGVTFVWAPQGPGWNWQAPGEGYPTWESLTRHGQPPLDRCAYLNEDATALLAVPVRVWRLPTADEIVRSLTRKGRNAGCAWDRRTPHAACRTAPDKETPLWAPDQAPIYYWSSDTPDATAAFAVNYTGGISALPRARPLGVGFRCVKGQ